MNNPPRRGQSTLLRWLHAVLWLGIAFSLWGYVAREAAAASVDMPPHVTRVVICLAAGAAAYIVAVGVLLGRPIVAAAVGIVVMALIVAALLSASWLLA